MPIAELEGVDDVGDLDDRLSAQRSVLSESQTLHKVKAGRNVGLSHEEEKKRRQRRSIFKPPN
jgi:hypothetical protein